MCGIFGYFDRARKQLDAEVLKAMGESIAHRGPDDCGIFSADGVAIGNQRLSIIDIAGGHQPFVSADGMISVVQNGEIFNHVELASELAKDGYPCQTHSDTEVLLRLYERDGIDFVSRLNGMFSIAIYDGRQDALYLIRDRVGVKPLFLYDDGRRLLFASEIKALLRADIPREMNPEALHHYLTYNYVPPPHTMFKGVQHLMPGHLMRIQRNNQETVCWWDLAKMRAEEKDESAWIDEFNAILDDAVRLRLRSDVPFGAFLSGGVDSSTVVGLMARHMDKPVDTFCIGFHDPRFDEAPFAQAAADRFGAHHVMERVDANMLDLWPLTTYFCDQPHGDISFLPTYRVSSLAAKHVKVVLTGDGADELFAGYDKYRDFFGDDSVQALSNEAFQHAYYQNISLFTNDKKMVLYTPEFATKVAGIDSYEVVRPLYNKAAHMDRLNQALYIDMMLLLPGNNLVKPDRMGMAVSLEARTPFLDYRMMEFAFRMPGHFKLRDGETKYVYKKAVTPLIGDTLAYRKKQMFTVPVGEWFKNELAEYCHDLLLSQRSVDRKIFDAECVHSMLVSHQNGSANFTREIRALLAVEIWHRIFMDKNRQGYPVLSDLI
ncbi:MAG: asparagine synthase (glutamine-hydrolyzing) [Gammaproteobacteria bacterium]